ncbi:hypothetical protein JHK87_009515 [Glycine soja]|nr:hypothetical protein JHK87_009515 [Glycine soja]
MVIGTTSELDFLESIGFCDTFSVTYHIPTLNTKDAKKEAIHPLINEFLHEQLLAENEGKIKQTMEKAFWDCIMENEADEKRPFIIFF